MTTLWIVHRDYERSEHDDYVRRVQPYTDHFTVAVPLLHPQDNYIVAWEIKSRA